MLGVREDEVVDQAAVAATAWARTPADRRSRPRPQLRHVAGGVGHERRPAGRRGGARSARSATSAGPSARRPARPSVWPGRARSPVAGVGVAARRAAPSGRSRPRRRHGASGGRPGTAAPGRAPGRSGAHQVAPVAAQLQVAAPEGHDPRVRRRRPHAPPAGPTRRPRRTRRTGARGARRVVPGGRSPRRRHVAHPAAGRTPPPGRRRRRRRAPAPPRGSRPPRSAASAARPTPARAARSRYLSAATRRSPGTPLRGRGARARPAAAARPRPSGDDQLAGVLGRDSPRLAVVVHQARALHAQACLQRPRAVVDARRG